MSGLFEKSIKTHMKPFPSVLCELSAGVDPEAPRTCFLQDGGFTRRTTLKKKSQAEAPRAEAKVCQKDVRSCSC